MGSRTAGTTAHDHQNQTIRLGEHVERSSERLNRNRKVDCVKLSAEEKAPQIILDSTQLSAQSSKGYRTVRATHGAHKGAWYYEMTVKSLGDTGAVRVGWSTASAELQAPVGADHFGYSYRSVDGSKVHLGKREGYGVAFKEGDVVGCLLYMGEQGRVIEKGPEDVVRYRGQLYFTEDSASDQPEPLPDSFIEFFVNGRSQGRCFEGGVLEGTYYPSVSLYTHASQTEPAHVCVQFGGGGGGRELDHAVPEVKHDGKGGAVFVRVKPIGMLANTVNTTNGSVGVGGGRMQGTG